MCDAFSEKSLNTSASCPDKEAVEASESRNHEELEKALLTGMECRVELIPGFQAL
jgi:hypothetical protein